MFGLLDCELIFRKMAIGGLKEHLYLIIKGRAKWRQIQWNATMFNTTLALAAKNKHKH